MSTETLPIARTFRLNRDHAFEVLHSLHTAEPVVPHHDQIHELHQQHADPLARQAALHPVLSQDPRVVSGEYIRHIASQITVSGEIDPRDGSVERVSLDPADLLGLFARPEVLENQFAGLVRAQLLRVDTPEHKAAVLDQLESTLQNLIAIVEHSRHYHLAHAPEHKHAAIHTEHEANLIMLARLRCGIRKQIVDHQAEQQVRQKVHALVHTAVTAVAAGQPLPKEDIVLVRTATEPVAATGPR